MRLLRRRQKPDPRECEEVRALLSDYVDAELDEAGRREVEEHVGFCPRCRRVLANLRDTLAGVRALARDGRDDESEVVERVRGAWRERS